MKAVIFSDSHKCFSPMAEAMEREAPVQQIIHAGDICDDARDLEAVYRKIPVAYVKGNNDFWLPDVPDDRLFNFGGVKIFLTHGHNYGVKYSLSRLYRHCEQLGADICIFGHTHRAFCEKMGNVTLFNSGSAVHSYGVLEVLDGNFTLRLCEI